MIGILLSLNSKNMGVINIQGIHDGNNFIVDSLARCIRDGNYPEWDEQFITITANDGNKLSLIVSKASKYLYEGISRDLEMFPDKFMNSSEVFYQEDSGSVYMIVDNNYYWATW